MNNASFVEKLGMGAPEGAKFYGIEPQQTARAIMFEVRTKDGKRTAYSYSYITEAVYEPETGIIIHVADALVTVKGRNLDTIYYYLLSNRLTYIQEDFSGTDTNDSDLFVEAIEINAQTNTMQ